MKKQLSNIVIRKPPLFIRIIATIVLTAFIWTFVMFEAVYGATIQIQDVKKAREVINKLEEFVLPYKFGRVVEQYVSDTNNQIKVVLIQDLHCHPEVQKNIYEIIRLFDSKYKIEKILVEGAPKGKINTVLFDTIPDKNLRMSLLDNLLDKGLISAAEYYESLWNKGRLYGLEDWQVYKENYDRIKRILSDREKNLSAINYIKSKIEKISNKYLSKKIKKLQDIINSDKFYDVVEKYCKKLNISLSFYPEVEKYINLKKLSKQINVKKVNYELKNYLDDIKKVLPYGVYNVVQQKLFSTVAEEYYVALMTIFEEYTKDLRYKYPNLSKFFEYIKLNYPKTGGINPQNLVLEEKFLKQEILFKFADKEVYREVLLLSLLVEYLKNVVEFRITHKEYEVYKRNKEKFKLLLKKYFEETEIRDVFNIVENKDLTDFYEVNVKRNDIFFNNLFELIANNQAGVYIVIVGGFHTEVVRFLKDKNISYIVVSPNVTKKYDDEIYERIILEKLSVGDFLRYAFAPPLVNVGINPQSAQGIILSFIILGMLEGKQPDRIKKELEKWKENLKKSEIKDQQDSKIADEILNTNVEFINKDVVAINGKIYKINISKKTKRVNIEELKEKPTVEKFSLINRIGVIFSIVSFSLVSSFLLTQSFLNPVGLVIAGLFSSLYIFEIFYLLKVKIFGGRKYELIDEFKNNELVEETKKPKWYIPAYTDGQKIYINTEVLTLLPSWFQRIIYNHELRHKKWKNKIGVSFGTEFVVSLYELFDFIGNKTSLKVYDLFVDLPIGLIKNKFIIDRKENTIAHILVEPDPQEDSVKTVRIAFPKKDGNAGFELNLKTKDVNVRDVSPVNRENGFSGVKFTLETDSQKLEIPLIALGDNRDIRDLDRAKIDDKALAEMLHTEAKTILARPIILRKDDATIIEFINFTRNGRFIYKMRLIFPPTINVIEERGTLKVFSSTEESIVFEIEATTNHPKLKVLKLSQIFRTSFLIKIQLLRLLSILFPNIKKELEIIDRLLFFSQFLITEDVLLAGSWQFLTYFGRDTILTVLMMKDVFKKKIFEIAIKSVLERMSLEGQVAHEEDLRKDISEKDRYDYKTVDDDLMFPIMLLEYLRILDKKALVEFITKSRDKIEKNLQFILEKALRYYNNQTYENLISIHGVSGNWRDSAVGLARGIYPADVNVVWMPVALKSIKEIIKILKGAIEPFEFYIDESKLDEVINAWEQVGDKFFKIYLSPQQIRNRLRKYYLWLKKNFPQEAEMLLRQTYDGVSVNEFLFEDKIPKGLQNGFTYYALSLDRNGRPIGVVNSDIPVFKLFFENLEESSIKELLHPIEVPYAFGGLMIDNVGIVIANPMLVDFDPSKPYFEQYDLVFLPTEITILNKAERTKLQEFISELNPYIMFDNTRYHGSVVWSWQVAMLELGLFKQIRNNRTSKHLTKILKKIEETTSEEHKNDELWTFSITNDTFKPTHFVGGKNHYATNFAQLWSLAWLVIYMNELSFRKILKNIFADGLSLWNVVKTNLGKRLMKISLRIITESNSIIFNFLRKLLLPIILSHEGLRLKGYVTFQTYLLNPLRIIFRIISRQYKIETIKPAKPKNEALIEENERIQQKSPQNMSRTKMDVIEIDVEEQERLQKMVPDYVWQSLYDHIMNENYELKQLLENELGKPIRNIEDLKNAWYKLVKKLTVGVVSLKAGWGHLFQGIAAARCVAALGCKTFVLKMDDSRYRYGGWYKIFIEVYDRIQLTAGKGVILSQIPPVGHIRELIPFLVIKGMVLALKFFKIDIGESIIERDIPSFPSFFIKIVSWFWTKFIESLIADELNNDLNNLGVNSIITSHWHPARSLSVIRQWNNRIVNMLPDPGYFMIGNSGLIGMMTPNAVTIVANDRSKNVLEQFYPNNVPIIPAGTSIDPEALYISDSYASLIDERYSLERKFERPTRDIYVKTSGNRAHLDQIKQLIIDMAEELKEGRKHISPDGREWHFRLIVFLGDHPYETIKEIVETVQQYGLEDCENFILIYDGMSDKFRERLYRYLGRYIPSVMSLADMGVLNYLLKAYCHLVISKPGEDPMDTGPVGTALGVWPHLSYHEKMNRQYGEEVIGSVIEFPLYRDGKWIIGWSRGDEEEVSILQWLESVFFSYKDEREVIVSSKRFVLQPGKSVIQYLSENGYNFGARTCSWIAALVSILMALGKYDPRLTKKLAEKINQTSNKTVSKEEEFMQVALEEAKKSKKGRTWFSAKVGAVVVMNGRIVGRGYNKAGYHLHAEYFAIIDALKNIITTQIQDEKRKSELIGMLDYILNYSRLHDKPERGKESFELANRVISTIIKELELKNIELYVTLQPCNKCAEIIRILKPKKVVYGSSAVNPKHNDVIERLRQNGIFLKGGVLQKQTDAIIRGYKIAIIISQFIGKIFKIDLYGFIQKLYGRIMYNKHFDLQTDLEFSDLDKSLKKRDISEEDVKDALREAFERSEALIIDLSRVDPQSIDNLFVGSPRDIAMNLISLIPAGYHYLISISDYSYKLSLQKKLEDYLARSDPNIKRLKRALRLFAEAVKNSSQTSLQNRRLVLLLTEEGLFARGDVLASIDKKSDSIFLHINLIDYVLSEDDETILQKILEYCDRSLIRGYHLEDINDKEFEDIKRIWRRMLVVEDFEAVRRFINSAPNDKVTIVVFGGTWVKEGSDAYRIVKELGETLASKGFVVRTGAGPGAMKAALEGASQIKGAETEGVIIILPKFPQTNTPREFITRQVAIRFYSTREFAMFLGNTYGIAYRGGYGTLGEIIECIRQNIPLVLFGKDYWGEIIRDIWETLEKFGLIKEGQFEPPYVTDSIEEAIDYLIGQLDRIKNGKRRLSRFSLLPKKEIIDQIIEAEKLQEGPRRVVFVGGRNVTGRYREVAKRLAMELSRRGIPLRSANSDSLEVLLEAGINPINLQSVLLKEEGTELTKQEKKVKNRVVVTNGAIHRYVIAHNAMGYVFLPGNFGKLDILFDILIKMQIKLYPEVPIVLIGKEFWDNLLGSFLEKAVREGLVKPEHLELIHIVDTVDEAISLLDPQNSRKVHNYSSISSAVNNYLLNPLRIIFRIISRQYKIETLKPAKPIDEDISGGFVALGENIPQLIELVIKLNPLLATYLQDPAIAITEKLIIIFKAGEDVTAEYKEFVDRLVAMAKGSIQQVEVVDNPYLLQQENIWALATLQILPDGRKKLIVNRMFFDALKTRSPLEQEELLQLLIQHELDEYKAVVVDKTHTQESFHEYLIETDSPQLRLINFAKKVVKEKINKMQKVHEFSPKKEHLQDIGQQKNSSVVEKIKEIRRILKKRFDEKVLKFFDALVNDDRVSDKLFEILYQFREIPGIGNVIGRVYHDVKRGNPGTSTELYRAYELLKEGYEILALGLTSVDERGNPIIDIDIVAYKDGKFYFFEVKSKKGEKGYDTNKIKRVKRLLEEISKGDISENIVASQVYSQLVSSNEKLLRNLIEILTTGKLEGNKIVSDSGEIVLETLSGVEDIGLLYMCKGEYSRFNNTVGVPGRLRKGNPVSLAREGLSKLKPTSMAYTTAQKILSDYSWIKGNAKEFFGKTIVFVSPGFKLTEDFLSAFEDKEMRIKVANAHQTGGLEPLVTEEIVRLTEMGMNAIGVSLLYDYGPVQTKDGRIVIEKLNYQDAIDKGKLIYIGKILVPIYGKEEVVKVYAAKFETKTGKNACVLYLYHPEITADMIYPSNYEVREKQMLLLGRGTLAILKEIKENPEFKKAVLSVGLPFDEIDPIIVQLNEALTTFAHPKVVVDKFTDDVYLNSLIYGFTTHTPVEAGLQKVPLQNFQKIGLNPTLWQYGIVRTGQIDLTKICMVLADVVNCVSDEHKEVTESMLYPEFRGMLYGIVNGINLEHWQLKEFKELVGKEYNKENVLRMYEIHRQAKERFAKFIKDSTGIELDTTKAFVVEARRKTDFKSVDTFIQAMRDKKLREEFLSTNIVMIFLGKQHPADEWGAARVKELLALMEGKIVKVDESTLREEVIEVDERLKGRIVFITNLNVVDAPMIFQGADFLCMLSELKTEASATGYMKGLSNAIPTITTKTGGPLEHIRGGYNGIFIEKYLPNGRPSPEGLIDALVEANRVYSSLRQFQHDQQNWDIEYFRMMWNALQTTPEVDITKVVKRYIKELWLPVYRRKVNLLAEKIKGEKEETVLSTKTKLACQIPVYSLRNKDVKYGIGKFADLIFTYETILSQAGVSTVLLLPHFSVLEESPYAPVSVYAINELYIDWIKEAKEIGMPEDEIREIKQMLENLPQNEVNYEAVKIAEFEVAKKVFVRFKDKKGLDLFRQKNAYWLDNYSSYMAAKMILKRPPNTEQEIQQLREQNPGIFDTYKALYEYMQYVGYKQLKEVIDVLHKKGCKIMFDIPFFRAKDSVDAIFFPEFFHPDKKSPYIWGQHWTDLVLYDWDALQKDGYRLIIDPITHWLKFGFDGVRLDAIHFAYNLRHLGSNIIQSGNEKGDNYVSKLITEIRKIKPDTIIIAEAFEGIDHHIRSTYDGIYTVANVDWYHSENLDEVSKIPNVWLQITSHDSPRIQNNRGLKEKYKVEHTEKSFETFFKKVLSCGTEWVSFVIGDQWGDDKEVKTYKDGKSLWRYRISLPSERRFDITEAIKNLVFSSQIKTDEGYFSEGYLVGKNLTIPVTKEIEQKLRKLQHFKLMYDAGNKELPFGDIVAPGLHCLLVSYQWIKFMGQIGRWSLYHHSYHNDFFTKVYDILKNAGLTEDIIPEVYSYLKYLHRQAAATTDIEEKAKLNIQLFGFIQGLLENTLYTEFVKKTNRTIRKDQQDIFAKLLVAADSFIARNEKGDIQILAGYPWFAQSWGRDTFISLPGLLLTTGRFEEAKEVFRYYAKYQREDGLIPNRIFLDGKAEYNTADASLWFIEALYKYYRITEDIEFIQEMLPVVNKIMDRYTAKEGIVYMDKDHLVVIPAQWSWMDAAPNGNPVTPRNGKPIEIQALFYNALSIASEFNKLVYRRNKNRDLLVRADKYDKIKSEVKKSINERFFEKERTYPYDVLDGDPHREAIRPNAVFLLSLSNGDDLLPQERKKNIIDAIEKELLTPYGLRTLSAKDPKYKGVYNTFDPQEVKDQAYHQGTVWPYLISHFIFGKINTVKEDEPYQEVVAEIANYINNLIYIVKQKGTLPEVFSGDAPHIPGGTVSQAWSVAAMLEVFDLIYSEVKKPIIDTREIQNVINIKELQRILGAV